MPVNPYIVWTNSSSTTNTSFYVPIYYSTAVMSSSNIIPLCYTNNYDDIVALNDARVRKHPKKAQQRAYDLLLEHLSDEQRFIFQANKYFLVEGGESGNHYRIRAEEHLVANIDLLKNGQEIRLGEPVKRAEIIHRLCGHCSLDEIPFADQLLAQKLMLEGMEEEFLQIANRHG